MKFCFSSEKQNFYVISLKNVSFFIFQALIVVFFSYLKIKLSLDTLL